VIDLDLFCGAGGASLGMHRAGLDPIGVEKWLPAARAHAAAGFPTIVANLDSYPWPAHLRGQVRLMWASPPCQPFSAAGDQQGENDARDGIPWWLAAVDALRPTFLVMENVRGLTFEKHEPYLHGVLVKIQELGYEFRWSVLDAADYGVPQNRDRFILIARNDGGRLAWPATTHCEGGGLFLEPWVTMADALGWAGDVVTNHMHGNPSADGKRYRYRRKAARPSPTVDCRALRESRLHTNRDQREDGSRQIVSIDRPAPALSTKTVGQWVFDRPATTLTADPRVFGPHAGSAGEPQSSSAVPITTEEAAILQGFPPDYPFQGNRTTKATQIGNAVPPALAEAVVRALLGTTR
jgi:DNA (cytosine-5)-methyltransferase 1